MPIEPLDQDDLITLWRQILPSSYTVPIEDEQNGQGFDVPSAQAAIFAHADQEVNETLGSHFLKPGASQTAPPASGPSKATVEISILRNASAAGELELGVGTLLQVEMLGSLGQTIQLMDFRLSDVTTMPDGVRGPVLAQAQATIEGYSGNVVAGSIVGFKDLGRANVSPITVLSTTSIQKAIAPPADPITDRFNIGMIGRFLTLIGLPSGVNPPFRITSVDEVNQIVMLDPPMQLIDVGATNVTAEVVELGDLGLEVTQAEDATGGRLAMLDAIGFDRRAGRVVGEGDEAYRNRLCELADTISPAAIERIAAATLDPCGICFALQETRQVDELKGFVWDLDPFDFGQITPVPNIGAGEIFGEGAVYLSQSTAWTFFIIRVGLGNEGEFGAGYDVTASVSPPNAWSQFFWDGAPVGYNSCIGQLHAAVDGARAAGVNFLILKDPALTGTC